MGGGGDERRMEKEEEIASFDFIVVLYSPYIYNFVKSLTFKFGIYIYTFFFLNATIFATFVVVAHTHTNKCAACMGKQEGAGGGSCTQDFCVFLRTALLLETNCKVLLYRQKCRIRKKTVNKKREKN